VHKEDKGFHNGFLLQIIVMFSSVKREMYSHREKDGIISDCYKK